MSIETIIREIKRELIRENKLKDHMEKRMKMIPDGALSECYIGKDKYYYQKVYIGKKQRNICLDPHLDVHRGVIKELMEKKAVVHGLPILKNNIDAMEKCVSKLMPYDPLAFKYGDRLGGEYYLDDDVCIREWMKKGECLNPAFPERAIHDTKRGVLVRSKSEVLICDTLFDLGILYKNETRLVINGRNYYPDCEIIHPKERRIIWWEHLGLIEKPGYVLDSLEKITAYGSIGIVPGKNLILTWETSDDPLTHGFIDMRLREYGLI